MMLTGYPVEDLALRASFVEASIGRPARAGGAAGRRGARRDRGGDRLPRPADRPGAAGRASRPARRWTRPALLHGGRVVITSAKHHLPNYGVFDEFRYFVPGDTLPVFRLATESARRRRRDRDLRGPVAGRRPGRRSPARPARGCSWCPTPRPTSATRTTCGSTWWRGGPREAGAALAYVNMVGGQDELVFDGDSIVVAADGDAAGPRAAVRGGAGRRRPGPAGRARAAGRGPAGGRGRRHRDHDQAGDAAAVRPAAARRSSGRRRRRAGPFWPRLSDRPRSTRALVLGVAGLRAQERLPLGDPRRCPAGSTRR